MCFWSLNIQVSVAAAAMMENGLSELSLLLTTEVRIFLLNRLRLKMACLHWSSKELYPRSLVEECGFKWLIIWRQLFFHTMQTFLKNNWKVLGKYLTKERGSDVTQSLERCTHTHNRYLACVIRFSLRIWIWSQRDGWWVRALSVQAWGPEPMSKAECGHTGTCDLSTVGGRDKLTGVCRVPA